ncbi:MAG: hypothetical protein M1820_001793 [Bogoriella megaspora]|nr:MAG: hypothetical protein M1820_001793 [Bogoriella megaspora]
MATDSRQYEIVVFGATGYTGQYTAEHITTNLPTNLRWALAGRSASKLEGLVHDLKKLNPNRTPPGIEVASLTKEDLHALAKKTRLLITTVGPYHLYGTPVVEACAANGTHYLDVTGETPWTYDIIRQYHDLAKSNGAIIIPQIGIESAPADLLAWMLVNHFRKTRQLPTAEVIFSIAKVVGAPSGGTLATVFSLVEHYPISHIVKSSKPYALSPVVPLKKTTKPQAKTSFWTSFLQKLTGVRTVPRLGRLTTSVSGGTDRTIVYRSWGLDNAGTTYGPNFRFSPYMRARNYLHGMIMRNLLGLGTLLLFLKPFRWLMKRFTYQPGQGPTREQTKKDEFICKALATADTSTASGGAPSPEALATLHWKGSFYHLTGVFLAEAAITILRQDTPAHRLGGGVLTPATLGQPFVDNLTRAGLKLEVEDSGSGSSSAEVVSRPRL